MSTAPATSSKTVPATSAAPATSAYYAPFAAGGLYGTRSFVSATVTAPATAPVSSSYAVVAGSSSSAETSGYTSTIYYKETPEGLRPFYIPVGAKITDARPYTAPAPVAAAPAAPAKKAETTAVVVTVLDAAGLPNSILDETDPFVKIFVGTQGKKTSVKDDAGKNATWGEYFEFHAEQVGADAEARFEVFDFDPLRNDFLGRASAPLVTGNYTLALKNDDGKSAGTLRVSIGVAGDKPGPFPAAPAPAASSSSSSSAPAPAPAPVIVPKTPVHVTVVRAQDLPTSILDKTDPYVKVTVGDASEKTSVKDNAGKKAEWNETLAFFVDLTATTFATVQVYDHDTVSDDFIGSNTVPLETGRYTLQLLNDDGDKKGTLQVAVSVDGAALPEESAAAAAGPIVIPKTPVDVTVVRVADLPTSVLDKTDPYVKVSFQTDSLKTTVKDNAGKNAVFNEVLRFDVDVASVTFGSVEVFDHDTVSDDLLGANTFPLKTGIYTLNVMDDGKNKGLVVLSVSVNGEQPADDSAADLPSAAAAPVTLTPVKVTVVKASNLPSSIIDKTDPYVKLTIGKDAKKTSVKNDAGKNAEWNETLEFQADLESLTTGDVSVFDEDTVKDDFIGGNSFPLASGTYTIDLKDDGKSKGTIVLTVSVPTPAPTAAAAASDASAATSEQAPKQPEVVKAAGSTVTVTVIEANNLPSSWTDAADPYVHLHINNIKKTTSVKSDAGKQAVWNEQFAWANIDTKTVTTGKFEVMEKETLKDDVIGSNTFEIKAGDVELPILNKGKENGKLRLNIKISA